MTLLYFIIALGLLIFVHELGHFFVAKRFGVGVQKFSLGFGPRLISFHYKETLYQISALPLGGYVKLTGESPSSEDADDPKSFVKKSVGKRLGIVLAGPTMNFFLTLMIMPAVFMLGRPVPAYLDQAPVVMEVVPETPAAITDLRPGDHILTIDGRQMEDWKEVLHTILLNPGATLSLKIDREGQPLEKSITVAVRGKTQNGLLGIEPSYLAAEAPVVDMVQKGGPADRAGLKGFDRIVAIDGETVHSWSQMTELIQKSGGKGLSVKFKRGEESLSVILTPRHDDSLDRYLIGIQKNPRAIHGEVIYKKYPPLEAIGEGMRENWRLTSLTFQVLGRLVTLQLSYKSLGGPIRIAQAVGSAAKSGLVDFMYFLAFISLQLGILNLLPIPVLDGGHALFMLFEVIRRKPLSERVQAVATQVGLFLLLFLVAIVTINDVDMVWGFREILDKIRAIF